MDSENGKQNFSPFERALLSDFYAGSPPASPQKTASSSTVALGSSSPKRGRRASLNTLMTHADNLALETKTIYDVVVLGQQQTQQKQHALPIPSSAASQYTRDTMALIFVRYIEPSPGNTLNTSKPLELFFKAEVRFRQSFADLTALVYDNLFATLRQRYPDSVPPKPLFSLSEMRPITVQSETPASNGFNFAPVAYSQFAIWIEARIPVSHDKK